MKAIILTQINLSSAQIKLLTDTDKHKYALNQHAEELKPDYRICSDYGVPVTLLNKFKQPIVALRDWLPIKRLIYACHIPFKGSTMVGTILYLISKNYKQILIVGDNKVHSLNFQNEIIREIDNIQNQYPNIEIYQFSNGNFNLPVKSIEDFIKE